MSADPSHERSEQVAFHRDALVERFHNRISNPFLAPKEVAIARRVSQHVPRADGRLLEVGCGEGSNLWFLARERPGCCLVGVDLSPAKARFVRQMQPPVLAAAADALGLPFGEGQFDAVLCRDLLHHVNWDRDGVVRECLRVLKPGGTLVILEGNGRTLLNRLFRALYPVERGMKDSTPAMVEALLARHGRPIITFVEPSSLVRAAGFVLGWPDGAARAAVAAVYLAGTGWEQIMSAVLPRRRWVYMLATVRRR